MEALERASSPLELRAEPGRRMVGAAVRYGEVSPSHRERFEAGSFALSDGRTRWLDVEHDFSRVIAFTGAGLELQDSPDALEVRATLPEIPAADLAISEVKAGRLTGFSVEFRAIEERQADGLRIIERADLVGVGLVSDPSYHGSRAELRREGQGLAVTYRFNTDRVTANRGTQRKERVTPGAFDYVIEDQDREIQLLLGRNYDAPLASRHAGTLRIRRDDTALRLDVDELPDTQYVRDFRASLAAGAAVYGADPLYSIPPIEGATETLVEPETGVEILVVREALLTAVAVVSRPPRGNPGLVEARHHLSKRRKVWL